jgi:hypothetical protein
MFCFFVVVRASWAQERIFLDERIRFSSENNHVMYVLPLLYRLSSITTNHISISRIHQALRAVVTKNNILQTALYFDTNNAVIQHCFDANIHIDHPEPYGFSVMNLLNGDRCIDEIINEILNQSDLLDLSKGRVIHCHILRQYRSNHSSSDNDDLLTNDDFILFSIHHAVFDGASESIFVRDFCVAYENNGLLSISKNTLQYIDYSVHERVMNMTLSRDFWQSQLQGYNLEYSLSLPVDRQRVSANEYSNLSSAAQITFNDQLTTLFLNYAASHSLTVFQLGLATFYVLLYKLIHSQTNLCIGSVNANRYRSELQNMIGMFVATLPYRIQLDSHRSFDELVKHVREKCLSILEHSHYPLQHILADSHLNQSNVSFLETVFDCRIISPNTDQISFDGATLEHFSLQQSYEAAKFDLMFRLEYNPALNDSGLSCSFICSRDLFEETTVARIARRFQHLFEQLFSTNSDAALINQSTTSINKLSLILPEEAEELQGVNFRRLETVVDEGM